MHRIYQNSTLQTEGIVSEQRFRPGQILFGQIEKIYPNDKAQVIIGNQRIVAKLETPLVVGNTYNFEVDYDGETVVLKRINKSPNNGNGEQLLKNLNFRITSQRIHFVQQLLNESIAFTKTQLRDAFTLLDKLPKDTKLNRILLDLIKTNSPINRLLVEAKLALTEKPLQEALNDLVKILNRQLTYNNDVTNSSIKTNESQRNLLQKVLINFKETLGNESKQFTLSEENRTLLRNILSQISFYSTEKITPSDLFTRDLQRVVINNDWLFSKLKEMNEIPKYVTNRSWKNEWTLFVNKYSSQNSTEVKLPFQLSSSVLLKALEKSSTLNQTLYSFSSKWSHILNSSTINIPNEDFSLFIKDYEQLIRLNYLNEEETNKILHQIRTMNQPQAIQFIHDWLIQQKSYINFQHMRPLEKLFTYPSEREVIITLLRSFPQEFGLLHEHQLQKPNTNIAEIQQTVKSQLLQVAQNTNIFPTESLPKMIHVLNGLQLQSVVDLHSMIHAFLQLPGEAFGFKSDVQLEFSSKKDENDELDPNDCRILFYLDLQHLNELVIDMQVKDRQVIIGIYNDTPHLNSIVSIYKETLENNLEKIQYKLQSLFVKKSKEENLNKRNSSNSNHEGLDYKGYDLKV